MYVTAAMVIKPDGHATACATPAAAACGQETTAGESE